MKTNANVLGVARSHRHERVHRPTAARGSYCKAADEKLLPLIRRLVDERPTYGYRRVTALVNRVLAAEGKPAANHKRVFRIMKRHGLLLQRHTGRRKGRLHDGKVIVMRSNLRWCSDVFEITCWNGEIVEATIPGCRMTYATPHTGSRAGSHRSGCLFKNNAIGRGTPHSDEADATGSC